MTAYELSWLVTRWWAYVAGQLDSFRRLPIMSFLLPVFLLSSIRLRLSLAPVLSLGMHHRCCSCSLALGYGCRWLLFSRSCRHALLLAPAAHCSGPSVLLLLLLQLLLPARYSCAVAAAAFLLAYWLAAADERENLSITRYPYRSPVYSIGSYLWKQHML